VDTLYYNIRYTNTTN